MVAALGDSVTAGVASVVLGENPRSNFSTGDDGTIWSHAAMLQQHLPHLHVRTINTAISGATSDDLIRQAQVAAAYVPDYATILIGVNDACSDNIQRAMDLQRYVHNVSMAAAILIRANPAVRIRLIPAPSLRQMHSISSQKLACRVKWSLSRSCRAFTSPPHVTSEKENFFRLVDAYNAALTNIANMYPGNVTVAWKVSMIQLNSQDISSIDCFHPSAEGQRKLAWMSFGDL
jgi:lysophospholipase L1-like esterase